ncbi:MAG: histidine phosphatase family protein [Caulobacteraceae bacterium]
MRRLILFRHGKTEDRGAGGEDIDRVLTAGGRADSLRVAHAMAALGFAPDLVLLSPAARARQTWDEALPAMPAVAVEIRPGLYDATAEEVADEISTATTAADTVLVVGHNPSLQELAVNLLIEGGADASDIERLSAGFPTAAAAVMAIDGGGGRLEALILASACRDGGE